MALRHSSSVRTSCQAVELWTSAVACEFRVAEAAHAWWHRERLLSGRAWDTLAAAALLRSAGPPRSLLMLGLAGGTSLRILRHLLPSCRFTAVDVDGGMVELGRKHMELDALEVEVHIAEAGDWVGACRESYDVVVDDCYLAREEGVYRAEKKPFVALQAFTRLLSPGGLLVSNLLTGPGHRRLQGRTRAAYRRTFGAIASVTTPESASEALVGGAAVLSTEALQQWKGRFTHQKDRELWGWLEVGALA